MRVFENRLLKRIFGPKRYKVTEAWRTVVLTKYHSGNQIEKDEMGGVCSTYGGEERRGVYRVLVGTSDGKSRLGRPRR